MRQEVYAIVERLTLVAEGQAALHEAKLVPGLIEKLVVEDGNPSVLVGLVFSSQALKHSTLLHTAQPASSCRARTFQVGIIDTLHNSMKLTTTPCLENDAMGRLARESYSRSCTVAYFWRVFIGLVCALRGLTLSSVSVFASPRLLLA